MDGEIHRESNVLSTAQGYTKDNYLIFMLGLNETIDQLAIASSVHWYVVCCGERMVMS